MAKNADTGNLAPYFLFSGSLQASKHYLVEEASSFILVGHI